MVEQRDTVMIYIMRGECPFMRQMIEQRVKRQASAAETELHARFAKEALAKSKRKPATRDNRPAISVYNLSGYYPIGEQIEDAGKDRSVNLVES